MPPDDRAAMIAHMASCPSCRRYDRVIRKGVEALRGAPEVKPRSRLGVVAVRRLARTAERREDRRLAPRFARATVAAVVSVAAVLAGLAWLPERFNAAPTDAPDHRPPSLRVASFPSGDAWMSFPAGGASMSFPAGDASAWPGFLLGAAVPPPAVYYSFLGPSAFDFLGPSALDGAYSYAVDLERGLAAIGFGSSFGSSLHEDPEEAARAMLVEYGRSRVRKAARNAAAAPDL